MHEKLHFLIGDATKPQIEGNKILVHCCNDIGKWGKGFVLAISKRWKKPEQFYRKWHQLNENFHLGMVQYVPVEDSLIVANLIGQHGIYPKNNTPPIRYNAIIDGFKKIRSRAQKLGASIHMPRIGCGLAGGAWNRIEAIIIKEFCEQGIQVFVYNLKK